MPISDPPASRTRSAVAWPIAVLAMAGVLTAPPRACAQKNSGPLLPVAPAPPPMTQPTTQPPARPAVPRTTAPRAAAPQPGPGGTNPDAEALARTLPLAPDAREIRDGMPPDRIGTERRLGLREPRGPATDMRGRTPSPREIVDALAPR